METQIYSIQTVEEALACIEAGADRIGLLVGPHDGPFPCAIDEETAKDIFTAIGDKAVKVLISVLDNEEEIIGQVKRLKPDVLHLCANYEGNPAFREKLRKEAPDVLLMEAVGVTGPEAIEVAREKAEFADMLILDTVSATVPGVGAAGITHDWDISRQIVEAVDIPVILAGGLGPDNVEEAIKHVRPFGVDSLTRTSVVEGGKIIRKDIDLVRQFCERARNAVK
ncbi:MAG TPA: phosphoribosylanthranilate isomerase [Halanaerobiaceae bacterium]|jgi:phosphoribosylanthranilate isomerase|nr:phosphoribosylanthranilate isomerase [Bacillota bacterium]HHU91672.1 phosphoribosylanthranilate isomerase [Halanaerobiaceae bacterium]